MGWQAPARVGPITNTAATFSTEMVQGSKPDRGVKFTAKVGWSVSQPTHVQAPFMPNMAQGAHPDQTREIRTPLRTGFIAQLPQAPTFSVEMAIGSQPARPRLPRITNTSDMVLMHQLGAVSQEMVTGWQPQRYRERLPLRRGLTLWTPEVLQLTNEMVVGSRPDRPRLFLAPRIGLPLSQPTHTATAFTQDMITVIAPSRHRERLATRRGHQWWQPDIDIFSIEMTRGSLPDRGQRLRGKAGWLTTQTEVAVAFSPDMVQGWQPCAPVRLVGKNGWIAFEKTHVQAVLSQEMVRGAQPERSRAWQALQYAFNELAFIDVFIPEEVDLEIEGRGSFNKRIWGRASGRVVIPGRGAL